MSINSICIKKVSDVSSFQSVVQLRKNVYSCQYPSINFESLDVFDFFSSIWCSYDVDGNTTSTSRLVVDCKCGLPSERYIKNYLLELRESNYKLAEFGRLINIDSSSIKNVAAHFRMAYLEAVEQSIDFIVLVTSLKKRSFYINRFGAELLCRDIGENFGSKDTFSLYLWNIKKTRSSFF